ncbi:glycosyltransferase family 2 protein [Algoriphagus persicinus]|uniref:glycosyltransferase family 2 protein n=1 Tax=Algoriphagus persicinus TaxID=3108754 RepID=UPI002B3D95FF|nr:glycosyltransferase family 2 protein [Algoriphagus sp. E1-3-M2]MEB2786969.1 glycosyltransferase family 2 protein [Algoriphagus sp. E1-3-M2]
MVENIKKTQNLISIITIVRNGVNEIEETIKSVLTQKNVNLEYIIIDGKSTDGTLEIIEKYKDNITIVVSEPDNGIYDAINKGIKLATGELIGLIHCGDRYENDILHLCYKKYLGSKSDIIYGNINILDTTDGLELQHTEKANHLLLENKMSIFHPATFISRACYNKNGLYNENYKIAADYEFFLRNFRNGVSFEYFPISLATFRSGGVSANANKLMRELFFIWQTHLGLLKAIRNLTIRFINHGYYYWRKKMVLSIIGKNNYNKLKIKKYKKND